MSVQTTKPTDCRRTEVWHHLRAQHFEWLNEVYAQHGIINRGFYADILTRWRTFLEHDRQVFFYDELLQSPYTFFQNICNFLDIDHAFLR